MQAKNMAGSIFVVVLCRSGATSCTADGTQGTTGNYGNKKSDTEPIKIFIY